MLVSIKFLCIKKIHKKQFEVLQAQVAVIAHSICCLILPRNTKYFSPLNIFFIEEQQQEQLLLNETAASNPH